MKFFDFCSGIGGGRIGLEKNGFECVGHSEIDKYAEQTYISFFEDDRNYGDLTKIDINSLPDFDFLISGFPCQTFSIAGKREGLEDKRGQIIYSLIEIMKKKKIKYFLLENVKGLINHNKGETLKLILEELDKAGYNVHYSLLNSANYGVPQLRERVYIVGFRKDVYDGLFFFPNQRDTELKISDFFDKDNEQYLDISDITFNRYLSNKYNNNRVKISDILEWDNYVIDCRQSDLRKYKDNFPTLRAGRHGLLYISDRKIKKMNSKEALMLQGFPINLINKLKNISETHLLTQAGNAMTVNVIEDISKKMLDIVSNSDEK